MTTKTVADLIQGAMNDSPLDMKKAMHELMLDRVAAVVDAKREQLANSYYNPPEDEEEDEELEDLEDDEEYEEEEPELDFDSDEWDDDETEEESEEEETDENA